MNVTTTARRTRVRPGRADDYRRIHAAVPPEVARGLREDGVVRWHIWSGGDILFHSIDTCVPFDEFLAAAVARGPADHVWAQIIADLLLPDGDEVLPLVWVLDSDGQRPGWADGDDWFYAAGRLAM